MQMAVGYRRISQGQYACMPIEHSTRPPSPHLDLMMIMLAAVGMVDHISACDASCEYPASKGTILEHVRVRAGELSRSFQATTHNVHPDWAVENRGTQETWNRILTLFAYPCSHVNVGLHCTLVRRAVKSLVLGK